MFMKHEAIRCTPEDYGEKGFEEEEIDQMLKLKKKLLRNCFVEEFRKQKKDKEDKFLCCHQLEKLKKMLLMKQIQVRMISEMNLVRSGK